MFVYHELPVLHINYTSRINKQTYKLIEKDQICVFTSEVGGE